MKRIETFLNTFFMIACITHVSFIGYYTINPVLPEIKIYSKPLKDIEFPLVFRLCTNKLLNLDHSEYNEMGYNDAKGFFKGQSKYNWMHFGWNGHTENGSVIDASIDEIVRKVSYDWNRTVDYIAISDENATLIVNKNITLNSLPIFPSCQMVDISDFHNLSNKVRFFI